MAAIAAALFIPATAAADITGKIHTPKRLGRGASFGKGATYAFYRIRRPDGGVRRMIVKAQQLPATTDKGNVKITITPGK